MDIEHSKDGIFIIFFGVTLHPWYVLKHTFHKLYEL